MSAGVLVTLWIKSQHIFIFMDDIDNNKVFLILCLKHTLDQQILNTFWNISTTSKSFDVAHCVKSVQIRSNFCSYFPARDTLHLSAFSLNAGKYETEITPYLDTFHAVKIISIYILEQSNDSIIPWNKVKFITLVTITHWAGAAFFVQLLYAFLQIFWRCIYLFYLKQFCKLCDVNIGLYILFLKTEPKTVFLNMSFWFARWSVVSISHVWFFF